MKTLEFKQELEAKTIALICNGASLLENKFGKEIDEHDIVIRIKRGIPFGYEDYVGSRTNFWDCSFTSKEEQIKFAEKMWGEKGILSFCNAKVEYKTKCFLKDIYKFPKKFVDYWRKELNAEPTVEFRILMYLLHEVVYDTIDVYGMEFDENDWFYGKFKCRRNHNYKKEKDIITQMIENNTNIEDVNFKASTPLELKERREIELNKYRRIYTIGITNSRNRRYYGTGFHAKSMLNNITALKMKSVLDVGCGDGRFCGWCYKNIENIEYVHGIDVMLNPHVEYPKGVGFTEGCMQELPYSDNSFDFVTAFDVIEHLLPVDVPIGLQEMLRVSKRGVVISVGKRNSPIRIDGKVVHLHPSNRNDEWWMERFSELDCSVEKIVSNRPLSVILWKNEKD